MPTLDLTALRPAAPKPLELGFLGLATLYLIPTLLSPGRATVLDGVIFYTHEAGHVLFSPFGTFLTIAGGTITQLLVPVAFVTYFVRQGQPFSAAIVLYWLARSLGHASVYAGDALTLDLPLSGSWESGAEEMAEHGETRHDWRNMLEMLGLLNATYVVSGALRLAGTLVFALGLYAGLLTGGVPVPARFTWR
ncbi:MAG: hypothetical protein VKQ33_09695 [Candidatus Sericytochromatia bacterium]|nr:hypothetical protein [Candidatus Sericytochromatia bacterium]